MYQVIRIREDIANQLRHVLRPPSVFTPYPRFTIVEGFEVIAVVDHQDVAGAIEEVIIREHGIYYSAEYWVDAALWGNSTHQEGETYVAFDRLTRSTKERLKLVS